METVRRKKLTKNNSSSTSWVIDFNFYRRVIDYSQTINRFTELDAYPLPKIDHQVHELAKCKLFSTLDLKSAYIINYL